MKQVIGKKQQKPRQKRSRQTVGYIFEATAQLLQTTEARNLTTNHIAKRAGYSVGTLYRYFPDKRAVMFGMAQHEFMHVEQRIKQAFAGAKPQCGGDLIRIFVAALLRPFEGRRAIRGKLARSLIGDHEFIALVYDMYERLIKRLQDRLVDFDPNSYAVINHAQRATLAGAVMGSIGMLELNRPDVLETKDHEQALNLMINGFLTKDQNRANLTPPESHTNPLPIV